MKGIIFDVDGTIWDATTNIAEAYNVVLKKENYQGEPITVERVRSVMGLVLEDIAERFFPELAYAERMALLEKCTTFECEYLQRHGGELYPLVEETIKELAQSYPIFIVSNCQDGYIESLFDVCEIGQYVKDYECSGRTGLPKGDNIKMIMERNHLEDAIYIGDTIKDQEACYEASIPFIYASFGFGEVLEYQDKIDGYEELVSVIQRIW